MLTSAIKSNKIEDWRIYRSTRNILSKKINKQKTKYIKDKMVDTKNNWKFLKQYNKCKKSRPPDRLNCNGKMLSIPKELANIANNFFISKIEKIRRGFTPDEITPIEILEKLVPKNPNSFQIPIITIQQIEYR